MTRNQAMLLVIQIGRQFPDLDGWEWSYEYPGIFTYRKGSVSVCFTPEYCANRGEINIQCQDDEGAVYDKACGTVRFNPDSSAEKLIALVEPFLEKAEKYV